MMRPVAIAAALLAASAAWMATSVLAAPPAKAGGGGARLYAQNCVACHQGGGQGIPGAFPALARDRFVVGDQARVVQVLLNGRGGMPTFRESLNDAEIASVLSYVRSAWGNAAPPVPPALVTRLRGADKAKVSRPIPGH